MHISKHNFKELEGLIFILDDIYLSQFALCSLSDSDLEEYFDSFLFQIRSDTDLFRTIISELKVLCDCVQGDVKYHF